jgi:hypothetical protein
MRRMASRKRDCRWFSKISKIPYRKSDTERLRNPKLKKVTVWLPIAVLKSIMSVCRRDNLSAHMKKHHDITKEESEVRRNFKAKLMKVLCTRCYFIHTYVRSTERKGFAVLRIRDVCPGCECFHSGSRIQGQKDPGSGSASKNLNIFNPKNCF